MFLSILDVKIRLIIIKIIKFYQKTFSFDHGPLSALYPNGFCKYRPTCSEYAICAIKIHGIIKGGLLAIWRVLRCNPFSKGGEDKV